MLAFGSRLLRLQFGHSPFNFRVGPPRLGKPQATLVAGRLPQAEQGR
jgi:hypothetical protein